MKKKLIATLLTVACAACCAFGLSACNLFGRPAGDDTVYAQEIQIDPQDITLKVGEEVTLTAIVMPSDAVNQNVTWSSGNDGVAVVDGNGKVTGIAPGDTEIFAQTEECDKFSFSPTGVCHVMVSDGLNYWPTPEGYTVGGADITDNSVTEITIASEYNGQPVRIINEIGLTSLKSITIPAGITRIEEGAFDLCTALENITVSENNDNYTSVDGILYNKAKTEIICVPQAVKGEVTVADGVNAIDYRTFKGCTAVTDVTVPASVTNIETAEGAFVECTSLENITVSENNANYSGQTGILYNKGKTEILYVPQAVKTAVIPDTITELNMWETFFYCTALTSIEIPASVTEISAPSSDYDFCSTLESITVDSNNNRYASKDGILYWIQFYDEYLDGEVINTAEVYPIVYVPQAIKGQITLHDKTDHIGEKQFQNRTELTGVTVGNKVTWIDSYAFSGCTSITNISLPDSVTYFGYYVFRNCTSLTSIVIPDGVTSIGGAFDGCSALSSVTIGKGVTGIDSYAFRNCTSLTSIVIPDGVTFISTSAFSGCSNLESINIPDSVTGVYKQAFADCNKLIQKENGISYVDKWAVLCDDGVKSAKFRADTVGIADSAFGYNHKDLTAVSFPANLKYIGENAFIQCSSLTSIIIPDSVTQIGNEAFYGCIGLTNVTIGKGVTNMSASFSNCTTLETVNWNATACTTTSKVFSSCGNFKTLNIGENVTSIPYGTFSGCSVETVNWNAAECTVTGFNTLLFNNCTNFTTLNIGSKVTAVPFDTFRACSQLENITVASANAKYHAADNCLIETGSKTLVMGIKSSIIPADGSVTVIGSEAFKDCSGLTGIIIPDSVTSINNNAFRGCEGLTSIIVPDSVTSIGASAFYGCRGLESITLPFVGSDKEASSSTNFGYIFGNVPSSLTTAIITGGNIGERAFNGCSSLTSIVIPDGVTRINSYAFSNCTSLTSIVIPDGVTRINDYAFSNCTSLTSISIPDSVTFIGKAFDDCSSLQLNEYGNGYYLGNSSNPYMLLVKPVSDDITSITVNANTKFLHIFDDIIPLCGNVRFEGTKEQWKKITTYIFFNMSDFVIHCTDGDINYFS